jgi:hypothetical protein
MNVDLVRFLCVFGFTLFELSSAQNFGQAIPNTTEEQCAHQILEWNERIMNSQQNGRQFEVNEEYNDPEIDQSVRRRNQFCFLVQNEDDGSYKGSFRVAANTDY